jgi:hypothetical protein
MKWLLPLSLVAAAGCADVMQSVTSQVARDAADATHRAFTAATTPAPRNAPGQVVPASAQKAEPAHLKLSGKLAVLELRNFTKELSRENAQYFTDVIRQASLKMEPALDVMTRENLLVLLESSGKKLDECEGECEVDTGRRIGADSIVSGEIQKVGSKYKLSLKLHDTHAGKLLGTAIASGGSIDELDTSIQQAAEQLYVAK